MKRASRRRRVVERLVLGSVMALAAAIIDRRVRRAVRRSRERDGRPGSTATFWPGD